MTISGKLQVDSLNTGLLVENKADIRPVLAGRINLLHLTSAGHDLHASCQNLS